MKKLTYKRQLILSVVIILLFNILTTVCKHWIFHSIGYVLDGLLWIIHPVYPDSVEPTKKRILAMRLAGVALVLIGVFVRAHYY